jgi:choline dehydrogenase-like flavoprotein
LSVLNTNQEMQTVERPLTQELERVLRLLAEVMLPMPLPARGPSIDDVAAAIRAFLAKASGKQVQQIRLLLEIVNGIIPVLKLKLDEIRKRVSVVLDNENNSALRGALAGIHQLVVFAYYADAKTDYLLGYARPQHRPGHRAALPVAIRVPNRVFDVVIAGTGPAGSLIADRLSSDGKSVLLLEAGPYIAESEITTDELDSIARLYKDSGLQSAEKPSSTTVLQGSCVGGGGVINNGIFFPLPADSLQTWLNAGFPFSRDDLARAYQIVAADLDLGDIEKKAARLNPAANFLAHGLGAPQPPPMTTVPPGFYRMLVNLERLVDDGEARGCRSTGLCNIGCGSERKVNSFQHYLSSALDGTRDVVLVPCATVVRAVMGSGTASHTVTGLEVRMADGTKAIAQGKSFVLCCGPVGSSSVLLRSTGLLRAAGGKLPVGQRFCGNVASPVFGEARYDLNELPYVQMCHVYVPPPDNDGFLLETWFSPPGGLALAMPGFLKTHRDRMYRYQRLFAASPVVGTQAIGTVTLKGDATVIELPLLPLDLDRFRRGMILLVRSMISGGAESAVVRLGNGRVVSTQKDIDALDAELSRLMPEDLYLLPMSTAHPQGGNALSADNAIGVIGGDFRVRGIENLRVCDGSVFPAVAGVNPQWTIFALAHLCAERFN